MDKAFNKLLLSKIQSYWNEYAEYIQTLNEDAEHKYRDHIAAHFTNVSLFKLLFGKRPPKPEFTVPNIYDFMKWLEKKRVKTSVKINVKQQRSNYL